MPRTIGKALLGIAVAAISFWVTLAFLDRGTGQAPAAATTASSTTATPTAAVEPSSPVAPSWKGWNETLYLAVNSDVAAAIARKEFTSARQHYELAGFAEGRKGATVPSDWDEAGYLKTNPDVATAVSQGMFVSGYHHYLVAGRAEGRRGGFPANRQSEK